MKAWLRDNSEFVPVGLDATDSTSYALRRGLRKAGWEREDLDDRVLVIRPEDGDTSYADGLLSDDSNGDTRADEAVEEAEEITFGLERDLQKAVRTNVSQLEPGLEVVDGGRERRTDAGNIDITAKDAEGQIVVVELKAGTANPDAVAQILSYMTAVAEKDGAPVRGIIVAGEFHKRVVMAARAVPGLTLKRYAFQFRFEQVE